MKKIKRCFIAFCGIALLLACGGGVVKKEKKCDREEMGLVGKVESLKVTDTASHADNKNIKGEYVLEFVESDF